MAENDIIAYKELASGGYVERVLTAADIGGAPASHQHAISDVTNLQTTLDGKQESGSYATLESGKVPATQLPSYVDDVLEFANLAALVANVPGETGKIYVTLDTNKTYRWGGSAYVEISASPGSTDAVPEGSTNLYHTTGRASAAAPVQSVAGRTGAVTLAKGDVGLGNVSNTAQVTGVTGTAPISSSGGTTPAISISAATTAAAGSMSSADKTKLDGIAAGAEVNVNADWNASSGDAQILNKPNLDTSVGANGGTAGSISTAVNGGTSGNINTSAGFSGVGGNIDTGSGFGGTSGYIKTRGDNGGVGGSIDTSGSYSSNGGSINTRGEASGASGGSIDTSDGGGSINTRGTGSIQLGVSGTRTTLSGTATAARSISLPDASGTVSLTGHTHEGATPTAAGFLSTADKTKLDGIASGAEVNVNADWNASSGDAQILNKPTSLTPTAHASTHVVGLRAFFYNNVGGMSGGIKLVAQTPGLAGNSIVLNGNGTDDLFTLIDNWNTANPSNTVVDVIGDSSEIPNNGTVIALSGATASGSDPLYDQPLRTTSDVAFQSVETNSLKFPAQEFAINYTGVDSTPYIALKAGADFALLGLRSGQMFFQGSNELVRIEQGGGTLASINARRFVANTPSITTSTPALDVTQIWNSSGVAFTALRANITRTAASATSSLLSLQVGSDNRFSIIDAATGSSAVQLSIGGTGVNSIIYQRTSGGVGVNFSGAVGVFGPIQFTSGSTSTGTGDVHLQRDSTACIGMRTVSQSSQTIRLYGTHVNTTDNFERLSINFNSTTGGNIGTEKGTTGTARPLNFQTDGVTRMTLAANGIFTVNTAGSGNNTLTLDNGGVASTARMIVGAAGIHGQSFIFDPRGISGQPTINCTSNPAWLHIQTGAVTRLSIGPSDFNLTVPIIRIGGTDATFPALKRSSTALQVRLADDTAFAPFAAGLITATGNLVLTDNDGAQTATFDAQSKLTANRMYNLPDASGTLALTSDITGGGTKTYAVFTATDNQPPATNFMTLDTRSSIAVLDADDTTDESAVFVGVIPQGASLGSGLQIRLHWMATTATSGDVVWDVSLERMNTDLDSDSFDTIASGTAAANGTSGILTVTEITLTTIDSVTAGDGFRLKITRDANNASDTMTGDAELVVCEVRSAA